MIEDNPRLLDEVINLVDNPNVLMCSFDKKFLSIPKEILTLTMQSHQKYFPTFNNKGEIIKKLNTYEAGSIEMNIPLLKSEYKNKNDLIFFILLFTYLSIFLIFKNKANAKK